MARRGLDSKIVTDAAVKIADVDGLVAVTMARVAKELGVQPPSLYNHVNGHDGLLRAVALHGVAEFGDAMQRAAVGRSGGDAIHAIATAYRRYAHQHPGCYSAIQLAPDPEDSELAELSARAVNVFIAVLAAQGIKGNDAIHATRALRASLHGFVTLEAVGGFGMALSVDRSFERLADLLVDLLDV